MLFKVLKWFDYRKTVIIIGGTSEIGCVLTKKFGHSWLKRWNVVNIDSKVNPDAKFNFFIDLNQLLNAENVTKLHDEIKNNFKEIDAMINVAECPNPKIFSIKDEDIF